MVDDEDDPPAWHHGVDVWADIQAPRDAEGCHFKAGPVVGRVVGGHMKIDRNKFPTGTLLFGNMWIDEKSGRGWALYTEALPPVKHDRVPVCLWYDHYKGQSLPLPCRDTARPFFHWPNPMGERE